MKAAFGQVIVRARFESAPAVLLTVFVGDDHHRQGSQVGVLLDQGDQFDAVHARHVNVGDHEIEMTGAHGIPAVHAVHGDFDFVTVVAEKLAFQFTHR